MEESSSRSPLVESNSSNSNPNATATDQNRRQLGGAPPRRNRSRSRRPRQRSPRVLPVEQFQFQAPSSTDHDKVYFQSYSNVSVHEEMIKDRVRTETYRKAILQLQSHIEGKVVVDVGCGTGILSIFCAQAGAKRVYAVDASEIAFQAENVVKANNLSDRIIVLHGRVEDVQIDEQVDVIVSEWMGYMLFYESMLGSVVIARERWLKPGGLILPSNAVLYMAPVTNPDKYTETIDFWQNVYGINMSPLLPRAKQCAFEYPCIEIISGEHVLTWPHVVKHVDCYTVTVHELESVTTSFKFQSMTRAAFHGFAFWFDVEFRGPANNHEPLYLEWPMKTNSSGSEEPTKINASGDDALLSVEEPTETNPSGSDAPLVLEEPTETNPSGDDAPLVVEEPTETNSSGDDAPLSHEAPTEPNPSGDDEPLSLEAPTEPNPSGDDEPLSLEEPTETNPSGDDAPLSVEEPIKTNPSGDDEPLAVEEPTETNTSGSQRRKRANPDNALVLSTAPEDPPTHWKQTMIYFYDPIDVEQDQVIDGSVTIAQSKEYFRYMNIRLEYSTGGHSFVKMSMMR